MRNSGSLVVSTLLLVAGMGLSSAGVPSSAPDAVGPPELAASAEVQALLAEAASLMENRRWEPALAKADQALETAQAVGDRAGAAPAKRLRAGALLRLRRTQEAAAAWREATVLWQALDEGPPQVEGLASEGIMLIAIDPESSEGIELISRALELAQKEESRHPLPTAQALHDAGHTALASKQQDNAIRLFSAAVCILDRYAPDSVALAESLIGLGRARIAQGEDLDAARASLVRALEISRKVAPGSAVEAKCLHRLGRLEETLENMPEAVDLYQQALRIKDVVDPAGFETFSVLTDLGTCEEELGNYDESRKHHLRALSIMEKISVDPLELVVPLINLGVTEDYAGNVDAAEAYYERNLEIQEKYGNDKARLAQALINVGNVALARWRFDVARERYESALAILVRYAPTNFGRGAALGNLAEMSYRQGDYEAAESYFRMNIAFLEENFPDSLMLSTALAGVGNVASMRGEPERAKAYHLRALEIRERKAPGSAYVSDSEAHLGSLCLALGELDEAEVHLRRGLDIEGPEATTRETASITSYLGRIAYRRGAFEEAARWHRRSAQIWAGIGGPQSPNVAVALADLPRLCRGSATTPRPSMLPFSPSRCD